MEELVEKAKNGDELALAELMKQINPTLQKIAGKMIHNEEDRKDMIQNANRSIIEYLPTLEKNKSFKFWMMYIIRNECYHYYKDRKKAEEFLAKYHNEIKTKGELETDIYFEDMISKFKPIEQKIFKLRYQKDKKIKTIALELGEKEGTIKSTLSRGRKKIKDIKKRSAFFIFILCLVIATTVIAVSIISYIKGLFELNSMGKNNDGVLMAIEHLDWYQELEMGYLDLGDGYQMRAEYLLMDEMNLYLVLDITSDKDVSKFTDIAFPDLKIVDEEGRVICNELEPFGEQYSKKTSAKLIENNRHNMKVLIYMYTDNFPESKQLNIQFSQILLSRKSKPKEKINANISFQLNLSTKFINRSCVMFSSSDHRIEKAIITETGFYALLKQYNDEKVSEILLIDEKGNPYDCYKTLINNNDITSTSYIVFTNFNDKSNEKLTLRINGIDYPLSKN